MTSIFKLQSRLRNFGCKQMGLCVQVFVYLLFILRFNDLNVLEPGLLLVDDLLDFQGE